MNILLQLALVYNANRQTTYYRISTYRLVCTNSFTTFAPVWPLLHFFVSYSFAPKILEYCDPKIADESVWCAVCCWRYDTINAARKEMDQGKQCVANCNHLRRPTGFHHSNTRPIDHPVHPTYTRRDRTVLRERVETM